MLLVCLPAVGDGSKKIKGCWDSIHVFEAQEKSSGKNAHYQLTSTVMLWLEVGSPANKLLWRPALFISGSIASVWVVATSPPHSS